jgi:hypothetical protein
MKIASPLSGAAGKRFSSKRKRLAHKGPSPQFLDDIDTTNASDPRLCTLCRKGAHKGGAGRLLFCGPATWVHLNCIMWAQPIPRLPSGELWFVHSVLLRAWKARCSACEEYGASVSCSVASCQEKFHFPCAFRAGAAFVQGGRVYCPGHATRERLKRLPVVQGDAHFARARAFVEPWWAQEKERKPAGGAEGVTGGSGGNSESGQATGEKVGQATGGSGGDSESGQATGQEGGQATAGSGDKSELGQKTGQDAGQEPGQREDIGGAAQMHERVKPHDGPSKSLLTSQTLLQGASDRPEDPKDGPAVPAVGGEAPAVGGGAPAVGGGAPAVGGGAPAVGGSSAVSDGQNLSAKMGGTSTLDPEAKELTGLSVGAAEMEIERPSLLDVAVPDQSQSNQETEVRPQGLLTLRFPGRGGLEHSVEQQKERRLEPKPVAEGPVPTNAGPEEMQSNPAADVNAGQLWHDTPALRVANTVADEEGAPQGDTEVQKHGSGPLSGLISSSFESPSASGVNTPGADEAARLWRVDSSAALRLESQTSSSPRRSPGSFAPPVAGLSIVKGKRAKRSRLEDSWGARGVGTPTRSNPLRENSPSEEDVAPAGVFGGEGPHLVQFLRVGALSVESLGEIVDDQRGFHSLTQLYPVGFRAWRVHWSTQRPNQRCLYLLEIVRTAYGPLFRITAWGEVGKRREPETAGGAAPVNPPMHPITASR